MAVCAVCGDEYYGACKRCKKIYEAEFAAGKIHPFFLNTEGISKDDFHLKEWTMIRAAEQEAEGKYAVRHRIKKEDVVRSAEGRAAIKKAADEAATEAIRLIKAWRKTPTTEQERQGFISEINRRSSY